MRMHEVADDLLGDLEVHFHAPSSAELSARVGMAARRDLLLIYTELLHNIARHSQATAVEIRLDAHRDQLVLSVADNGRGFNTDALRRRERSWGTSSRDRRSWDRHRPSSATSDRGA